MQRLKMKFSQYPALFRNSARQTKLYLLGQAHYPLNAVR